MNVTESAAIKQRTEAWRECRLGKITASRINDVMAKLKNGGEAAGRKNYRAQLVVERMTGHPVGSYTNGAMMWGCEHEDAARVSYEFVTGNTVDQIGFIDHPTIPMSGASPDGLIGEDGMLEIKCPNTSTHIEWMLAGGAPSEHVNQMQWQMECAGRKWCDFVSYDPRMPLELQLFIVRVERDDKRTENIKSEVAELLCEVNEMVSKLTEREELGGAAA